MNMRKIFEDRFQPFSIVRSHIAHKDIFCAMYVYDRDLKLLKY